MQTDMVLERYLRVLRLEWQAAGRDSELLGLAGASKTSRPTPSETLSLKRQHTIQKATLSNSATSSGPTGAIFIQTTTWEGEIKSLITA